MTRPFAIAASLGLLGVLAACQHPDPRLSAASCWTLPNKAGVLYRVCRRNGQLQYTRLAS